MWGWETFTELQVLVYCICSLFFVICLRNVLFRVQYTFVVVRAVEFNCFFVIDALENISEKKNPSETKTSSQKHRHPLPIHLCVPNKIREHQKYYRPANSNYGFRSAVCVPTPFGMIITRLTVSIPTVLISGCVFVHGCCFAVLSTILLL